MIQGKKTYSYNNQEFKAESTTYINKLIIYDLLYNSMGISREQVDALSIQELEANLLFAEAKAQLQEEMYAKQESDLMRKFKIR